MKLIKHSLQALLLVLIGTPMIAQASFVGATLSFIDRGTIAAPQPDRFTLRNESDPGIFLTALIIDLSGAAANSPVWDTLDNATPDYFYGAALGAPVTGINPGVVGMIPPTAAEQTAWEESQQIALAFTDFDAGETFLFTSDIDSIADFLVTGAELAGSTFTVAFSGAIPGGNITLTGTLFDNLMTPDTPNDALGHVSYITPVPLPAAVWLMGAGLFSLLGFSRRKD